MIWRAFATAVLLTAGTAQAQTIVARSGEHKTFTRLVMRLPSGADWSLTQSGTTATVNVDAPEAVFDISRVFSIIPRKRLQSVQQNGPGQPLRLQLACECNVTSYMQKNGYLVVDIHDGKRPEQPVVAASRLLPLTPAPEQGGYRFSYSQSAAADARMALELAAAAASNAAASQFLRPLPSQKAENEEASESGAQVSHDPITLPLRGFPATRIPDAKPVQEAEVLEAVPEPVPAPVPIKVDPGILLNMEETERAAIVNQSEQRLLQQIGRAANQGLLSVAGGGLYEADPTAGLDPLGHTDRRLNPLDHISVTSAIDRETGLLAAMNDGSTRPLHCLPDKYFAVHRWGNESLFADQVGPLRAALVREFDDVNPASVYALARNYLFFGFGAEARSILTLLPEKDKAGQEVTYLEAMALLMDNTALPVNHPFAGQQSCDGLSAFWGAIGDRAVKKSANTDAIQQAFSQLPQHLRVHLGPRVSKMFAEAGDHHIAEAVLRAVDRTGVEDVPEINLAEAAIAELTGDTEKVAEELTSEVAERTGNAPAALIELVELSVKERKALSPDVPDLIASYELENRETELGAELRQAETASLALMGQFPEAFIELSILTEQDGPNARAKAIEPVMLLLTERADDVTFLQYALTFSSQATAAEAEPVAMTVARRLLDLGFAEQTLNLLNKLSLEPENSDRRLLVAEASLALGKPHRALVELMGLEGAKPNRIRAEALWENGEFDRAGEYLLAEQEADAAARGFWHSENMGAIDALEEGQAEQFGPVASVTTQISETAEDPQGLTPLAHAKALVESSIGTRGGIEELLSQVGTNLASGN